MKVPCSLASATSARKGRWDAVEELAGRIDARPKLLIVVLVAVYFCVVLPDALFKPLWHDELITYDLASSPSVPEMLRRVQMIDLNPPVLYVLDYVAIRIPGAHYNDHTLSLAARLPSILGGLAASLGLFVLMRRKIGPLYAFALACTCCNIPFLNYVIEDRPYALVSGLIVWMILVWERATQEKRHFIWVVISLLLGLAVMGSHFLSGLVLVAFFAAAAVGGLSRKRLDIALLVSYVVPFAIPLVYFSKFTGYESIAFPVQFQPTWKDIPLEYGLLLGSNVLVLGALFAICLVLSFLPNSPLAATTRGEEAQAGRLRASASELTLLIGMLLQPVVAVIAIMSVHGAFYVRYGLPGCIPIAVLLISFIYALFNGAKSAALSVCFACGLAMLPFYLGTAFFMRLHLPVAHDLLVAGDYHGIEADLPLVVASGLTYVEMNHREPAELLDRVYYLTDKEAAMKYANATLFERENEVREMFQYPARVETLKAFEAKHPRFLVLGTEDYPEDWLLRKLKADGEDVRLVGVFRTTYKDNHFYEVTLKQ
jgi:Dolichyl-phosphate-mannose-protein mannosyltransferase